MRGQAQPRPRGRASPRRLLARLRARVGVDMTGANLVEVEVWAVHLPVGRRLLRAVDGVTLSIGKGETLGLIGESGSGKTTIGRAILRRAPLTRGRIRFDGVDISALAGESLRRLRRRMQP